MGDCTALPPGHLQLRVDAPAQAGECRRSMGRLFDEHHELHLSFMRRLGSNWRACEFRLGLL